MMRIALACLACLGAGLLVGCASAPLHYYTLLAPDPTGMDAAPAAVAPALPFAVLPVSVPAQVDQPQLVVRDGAQRVLLLNGERWIAPLADELRSALAADLAGELGSQNTTGLPDSGAPGLRIKLEVQQFDSWPGSYALLAGTWSVRVVHGTEPDAASQALTCASSVRVPVGAGYTALVQGHQRAVAMLAAKVATVARALGAGQAASCPA
ncbi:MAG: membrane integrity-associated transporter subunit PqiC [Xanthomonadales bacterium]|nr:membrane integrity-associated transporter subunit PqiC [Xanthomonadales bacterium]